MTTTNTPSPASDVGISCDDVLDDLCETYRGLCDAGPAVRLTHHGMWSITRSPDVRAAPVTPRRTPCSRHRAHQRRSLTRETACRSQRQAGRHGPRCAPRTPEQADALAAGVGTSVHTVGNTVPLHPPARREPGPLADA